MSQLYASLFYQPEVTDIFSDRALLNYMIQVEVALAKALAKVEVIPISAATIIEQVAQNALEAIDFDDLAVASGLAGNIAIPFVKQFTAIVKQQDQDASRYVHWGATSQDIIDTAMILQCRDALLLIEKQLQFAYRISIKQAQQYRNQVMIGRTWLQQALPITLGHKFARWAAAFKRDLDRLQAMKSRVLTAQLGGAVGSLASLGNQGSAVVQAFAAELNLTVPECTWHGERDRITEMAATLAIIVGNTGKMAKDWSLLMQTEIAEVYEPTTKGRGGSSTMPHKRNPVAAASVLAAANRIPALMASVYQSMVQEQVNPDAMQCNLECTNGLIMAEAVMMALASKIGRLNAHQLVEQACQQAVNQQQHLKITLSEMDEVNVHLSPSELNEIFKPTSYLGNIQAQIDAVLKAAQGDSA